MQDRFFILFEKTKRNVEITQDLSKNKVNYLRLIVSFNIGKPKISIAKCNSKLSVIFSY